MMMHVALVKWHFNRGSLNYTYDMQSLSTNHLPSSFFKLIIKFISKDFSSVYLSDILYYFLCPTLLIKIYYCLAAGIQNVYPIKDRYKIYPMLLVHCYSNVASSLLVHNKHILRFQINCYNSTNLH